ncbi:hypothetical protein ACQ5R9_20005 [Stenotrophomonas geniculata]|jgi:hypothetical protein|uniref:hypothetical protein n=1 Tax=Stenotrophomonas geniculata TaxID=86188 RepID=UPI003D34C4A2
MNQPSTKDGNPSAVVIAQRLRRSSLATAERTAQDLDAGLALLNEQMAKDKTSEWQAETVWLLDVLKLSGLDGIDLQLRDEDHGSIRHKREQATLVGAHKQAKQAVLSHSSPTAAAVMLSQHADRLIDLCRQIAADARSHNLAEDHIVSELAMQRAKPKDKEDQNQIGV